MKLRTLTLLAAAGLTAPAIVATPAVAAPQTAGPITAPGVWEFTPIGAQGLVRGRQAVEPSGPMQPGTVDSGDNLALAMSKVIYLSKEGVLLQPGNNDSSTNRSTLISQSVQVPAWNVSAAGWTEVKNCLTTMFAPFDVEVTDVDPGATPHIEALFASTSASFGFPPNVGGVSPFTLDCSVIERSIAVTFTSAYGNNYESICETMAQEVAHSYGLDHQLLASDPMTYLPYNGLQAFQDQTVACGEDTPRPCGINGSVCRDDQNSFEILTEVLGAAVVDPEEPPVDPEEPPVDPEDPEDPGTPSNPADPSTVTSINGCSTGGAGSLGLSLLLATGMVVVGRRRRAT